MPHPKVTVSKKQVNKLIKAVLKKPLALRHDVTWKGSYDCQYCEKVTAQDTEIKPHLRHYKTCPVLIAKQLKQEIETKKEHDNE